MSTGDVFTQSLASTRFAACDTMPVLDESRSGESQLFSRILVPIDGSDAAMRAIDTAVRLALRDDAALALLAVVDTRLTSAAEAGILPSELLASLRQEARALLLTVSLSLPPAIHPDEIMREGQPAQEIVTAAQRWRADLIVLGRPPRTPVSRLLAGGTATTVARRAPCPVLFAHAPAPAVAESPWGWWRQWRGERAKSEPDCPARHPA